MRRILVIGLGAADVPGAPLRDGAMAQDDTRSEGPFSFLVNGRTLPAGNYTITRDGMASSVYLIRGDKAARSSPPCRRAAMTRRQPAVTDVRAAREPVQAVGDLGIGE